MNPGESQQEDEKRQIGPIRPYMMVHSQVELDRYIEQNNLKSSTSILDEDEVYIQADLMLLKSEKTRDMTSFLHWHNMQINHKKYLCSLKCYARPEEPTAAIRGCVDLCQKGEDRFNAFVSKVFEVRLAQFQACIQLKQKDSLYTLITCYEDLFSSFESMKSQIKSEQEYYQP